MSISNHIFVFQLTFKIFVYTLLRGYYSLLYISYITVLFVGKKNSSQIKIKNKMISEHCCSILRTATVAMQPLRRILLSCNKCDIFLEINQRDELPRARLTTVGFGRNATGA